MVSVVPDGLADFYGLEPGDALIGWQGRSDGEIRSVFDALELESALAPRGDVVLEVDRAGERLQIPVLSGRWALELTPCLGPAGARADREASARLGDDPQVAAATWATLAEVQREAGLQETRLWLTFRAGEALSLAGKISEAEARYDAVRSAMADSSEPREALLRELEGLAWQRAGELARAQAAFERALELRRAVDPESAAVATTLIRLVEVGPGRIRIDQRPLLLAARRILERQPSSGPDRAHVLSSLGNLAFYESDLDAANEHFGEVLELCQRSIPGSSKVAYAYFNLGLIARRQGRLDDAETLLGHALRGFPDDRALGGAEAANSLALVERDKGNYRAAREHWEGLLVKFRALNPRSSQVAGVLSNLGNLARRLGDLDRAETLHPESLSIRREIAPDSRDVAASLTNLGIVALRRQRLGDARERLEAALAIKEQLAPNTETHANTVVHLAELARAEGNLDEAEQRHRDSLAMRLEIAPESIKTAENLVFLGKTLAAAGQLEEAERWWRRGIDLLDEKRESFQCSAQERSIFASRFQDYYRDLALFLVERGRFRSAFELLERSRARALRVMEDQKISGSQVRWSTRPPHFLSPRPAGRSILAHGWLCFRSMRRKPWSVSFSMSQRRPRDRGPYHPDRSRSALQESRALPRPGRKRSGDIALGARVARAGNRAVDGLCGSSSRSMIRGSSILLPACRQLAARSSDLKTPPPRVAA